MSTVSEQMQLASDYTKIIKDLVTQMRNNDSRKERLVLLDMTKKLDYEHLIEFVYSLSIYDTEEDMIERIRVTFGVEPDYEKFNEQFEQIEQNHKELEEEINRVYEKMWNMD